MDTGNIFITYFCKKLNQLMPTLLRAHKPIHVHVESSDGIAKFEIETEIKLIENLGLSAKDLRMAETILMEKREEFRTKWIDYHG